MRPNSCPNHLERNLQPPRPRKTLGAHKRTQIPRTLCRGLSITTASQLREPEVEDDMGAVGKHRVDTTERLAKLRELMKQEGVDVVVVPSEDQRTSVLLVSELESRPYRPCRLQRIPCPLRYAQGIHLWVQWIGRMCRHYAGQGVPVHRWSILPPGQPADRRVRLPFCGRRSLYSWITATGC